MFHSMAETNENQDLLAGDVWQFLDAEAPKLINEYFTTFDGRRFNTLGGGGDSPALMNHFDSSDLVAVSTLSVNIPGSAAIEILETQARKLNALLAQIPNNVDLYGCDISIIETESPAAKLFDCLTKIAGVGWVTANKLLARKRPHLLPVYDSVVKDALQPNSPRFWVPLWNEFSESDGVLAGHLERVRSLSGPEVEGVSLLRILDVAIWMRNCSKGSVPLARRCREDSAGVPALDVEWRLVPSSGN
jgi:hypothetical protein